MISLLIYGILAAGAIFGAITVWHSVENTIAAPYVAKQIAKDQQVVDAANKRADDAEVMAKNAQSDTAACVATSKAQSAQVLAWQAEAARRQADAAKAKAAGAAAHQAAQTAIQRYQEIAARPPVKDETCEAQLGKVDKLLRDAARARAAAKPVPK